MITMGDNFNIEIQNSFWLFLTIFFLFFVFSALNQHQAVLVNILQIYISFIKWWMWLVSLRLVRIKLTNPQFRLPPKKKDYPIPTVLSLFTNKISLFTPIKKNSASPPHKKKKPLHNTITFLSYFHLSCLNQFKFLANILIISVHVEGNLRDNYGVLIS